ncbi:30S ribosomal protein S17 [Candidatus Pacearchaeota archaeon]|nr:30S ribosomal protein S17 [Candidatus Pacearchaeota archaeon]
MEKVKRKKEKEVALRSHEKKADVVATRGRTFEGFVTRKFHKRVAIEFERTVYVSKYERFLRKKTRIHARLPENMEIEIDDLVRVKECRPLSKIIHFIVVEKIKSWKKAGAEK